MVRFLSGSYRLALWESVASGRLLESVYYLMSNICDISMVGIGLMGVCHVTVEMEKIEPKNK
jgi:hypothetical protein